jgi:hypothetical protein
MAESLHPAATQHAPGFITAPGETDVLMVIMSLILLLAVLGFGILYFRLHSLPEHMAHKGKKVQLEIVAVLGLISLFTHMHIFWIAGLLLALIDLPDFGTPLNRIAGSAEKLAGLKPGEGALDEASESLGGSRQGGKATEAAPETSAAVGNEAAGPSKKSGTNRKERAHA